MAPVDDKRAAVAALGENSTVPAAAAMSVDALRHKVRQLVITEETAQPWGDLRERAAAMNPESAAELAALLEAMIDAPTQPSPPRGWLEADLAGLDCARAVTSALAESAGAAS
ncbi:hypothetical protein [Bounagaea algeriensis]